jgi:hypothetical protein
MAGMIEARFGLPRGWMLGYRDQDQWAPWDSNPQPTDFPRQLALVRAA